MTRLSQVVIKNRLLRRLPDEAFEYLSARVRPVDLPLRQPMVVPGQPIRHICFIESGLASMVAASGEGKSLELRHIGFEGIVGYPALLGVDHTPNSVMMQVAGRGLQVSVDHILHLLDDRQTRELILRYVHTCELQLAHTALAAAKYSMNERMARWLLMCQDRLESDELPLTHEFLSLMLGVRRSGVTEQLHILEGLGAIRSTRCNVHVRSRQLLLEIAGGCYGTPEQEYERLIGATPPSHREWGGGVLSTVPENALIQGW